MEDCEQVAGGVRIQVVVGVRSRDDEAQHFVDAIMIETADNNNNNSGKRIRNLGEC